MDFKLNKENFTVGKLLYDGVLQQSVELDYVLPDYYPEVFKVLSVKIMPSITKRAVNSQKLEFELSAKVRLIYVSEQGDLSAVEQTLGYSKSVELPYAPKSPIVCIIPYTESASCRVVNKRRVDIRGIVSVAVKVTADEQKQAVCDAWGSGIQLKKAKATYPCKKISVTKLITVADEVSLGLSKPALKTVLNADATVLSLEKKLLSGKLLCKGEAEVSILYVSENSTDPETFKFMIPFSQIADIEGLDDRFEVFTEALVTNVEISPITNPDEALIECELCIEMTCTAIKFANTELATDAYSTLYETSIQTTSEKIECLPTAINENHKSKNTLKYYDGEIASVIYAGADTTRVTSEVTQDGDTILRFRVIYFAFAKNEAGKPIYLEATELVEHTISGLKASSLLARAYVNSVSYNLVSSNAVELVADIKILGVAFEACEKQFISELSLNQAQPIVTDPETAIKLYYAEKGEEPWEIAKRSHTSVSAVIEENELEGTALTEPKMILIPIVD
ncbi:MAG: DUF3794 domain-containing protein [Oscillospiraceae bacterium]|nr:DUF3794 domain-containing protein [Oscillospiraceae bacterium]